MWTLFIALAVLVAGYCLYGRLVEKIFVVNPDAGTPAVAKADGVDFVVMPAWRVLMIQFLNIAGLGPIFGAILGAMYGPAAFIWIVLGCIFAGGVHDYCTGMLSCRHGGASIPEVVGRYLGWSFRQFMRGFSIVLLLLLGVVFMRGPAQILAGLAAGAPALHAVAWEDFWLVIIFIYFLLATVLPIDKFIGRFYPFFGALLLVMALGLVGAMVFFRAPIPELTLAALRNQHADPAKFPLFPMLCITVACGAISGFHATQSPIMARCLGNERLGRRIFYGAMIMEGAVALIWAAAAMSFFGGAAGLNTALAEHGNNAAWVVNRVCNSWLGLVGGALAILGVVACPVTSGDTAFRSARLIIADFTHLNQKPVGRRLLIALPLFAAAAVLTRLNFDVIWRYFSFSNQALATVVLWAGARYLAGRGRNHWLATAPATFMTVVCVSYILVAPEGLKLSLDYALPAGLLAAAAALAVFLARGRRAGTTPC